MKFDLLNPVWIWWLCLSTAAVVNIGLWLVLIRRPFADEWMARLSGLYVFVCAFRSVVPRADVQRLVLFDSWISSIFVGRSAATLGELAFVAQWALLLRSLGTRFKDRRIILIGSVIVPMIAFAECCSWYGVITTKTLGNTIEESTWAATFTLVAIAIAIALPHLRNGRTLAIATIVGCAAYVGFMVNVDVPMYWHRYQEGIAAGSHWLSFSDGLKEAATAWHVSDSIADWREEIPWMSFYFTLAVWSSLGLCRIAEAMKMKDLDLRGHESRHT